MVLLGQSSQKISFKTRIERIRVTRVLTIYLDISDKRGAGDLFQHNWSAWDVSRGRWRNKRRSSEITSKWGRDIKKQSDSGYSVVMVLSGPEVVDNIRTESLQSFISRKVKRFWCLFSHLKSIHHYRFTRICSSSCQSQWKAILWRKR
jgi:hypothetical protein